MLQPSQVSVCLLGLRNRLLAIMGRIWRGTHSGQIERNKLFQNQLTVWCFVLSFFPDPPSTPNKLLSSTELCSWNCLVTMVIVLLFTWGLCQRTQATTFHQQALALEFFVWGYSVPKSSFATSQLYCNLFLNSFVTSLHYSFYPVFAKNAKLNYLKDKSLFDCFVTKKCKRA